MNIDKIMVKSSEAEIIYFLNNVESNKLQIMADKKRREMLEKDLTDSSIVKSKANVHPRICILSKLTHFRPSL